MAKKQKETEAKDRGKPVRSVAPELAPFVDALFRACAICERGSAVARYGLITFQHSRLQAFDGVVLFQSKSIFPPESAFVLGAPKLLSALSLIDPADKITESAEFVRMVQGPLSVRVRKMAVEEGFFDHFKLSKNAKKAGDFLDILRKVAPFVSEDATKPWSLSVLFRDDYAYATNNLALVRSPFPALFDKEFAVPLPAVKALCELQSIDYIDFDNGMLTMTSGKLMYRFATGSAVWPDMSPFFEKMPKKLPLLPEEMRAATSASAKLSERFSSLSLNKVESQSEALESTYEVDFEKGKGIFSARLLSLIMETATHADFSFYPKPIFFKGDKIEGTAIGAAQP